MKHEYTNIVMDDLRVAEDLAELFRALGDPTRVRILSVLERADHSVGDLAQQVGLSEPAVSHHLRILRHLRLVRARREGRHVFYSLDDEHVAGFIRMGLEHAGHA